MYKLTVIGERMGKNKHTMANNLILKKRNEAIQTKQKKRAKKVNSGRKKFERVYSHR